MIFARDWAFPSLLTFQIKPIELLLGRYITADLAVIDPFARDSVWGTCTNDLNPETSATEHLDAIEFLDKIISQNQSFDVALFDPPYSSRQVQECYQGFGRRLTQRDGQMGWLYREVKDRLHQLVKPGGYVISFGWSSVGMGISRGYEIDEILLVCHGGVHNDTIVTCERKLGGIP